MVETTDGFRIADVDLQLRGPGDLFGTRQSGLPQLSVADLVADRPIFDLTREATRLIVERDPNLRHPDHATIRRTFEQYYQHLFRLGSES
jgi:ATP-dependent DNA helicase RecG